MLWASLFFAILALRAPGLVWDVLNIDESDFYVYGRLLAEGGQAYVSFVEKKPPLVYGFFALAIQAGFEDLRWIRAWTALCVFLGSIVAHCTAMTAGLGSRAAGVAALVFAGFSSNITVATDCETLMNLPVLAGVWWTIVGLRRGRATWDLLAGVCLGVATGFKHQAAAALLAMVSFHATRRGRGRTRSVLAVLGGFLGVMGLMTAWFFATDRLEPFVEWNIARNFAYSSGASPFDWQRVAGALGLYGLANGAVFLWLWVERWPAAATTEPEMTDHFRRLAWWVYGTAWLGISVGGRFYGHYFLQLVPGAALLAASFWHDVRVTARARRWVATLMVMAVVGFGANTWARGLLKRNFPSQDAQAVMMATWIRSHTQSEDKVFVWGYFNPIYYLANRLPATRFVNPSPVIGDFDPLHVPRDFEARPHVRADDGEVLVGDLIARRCALIVDTAPSDLHGWSRFPLDVVPSLAQHVRSSYKEVARVAGAVMYGRKE